MSSRIKLQLKQILEPRLQTAFAKLGQDAVVPKAEAWAVARTKNQLAGVLADWKKAYQKAALKHGTPQNPDDPNSPVNVPKEKQGAFFAELEGLAEQEIELFLDHQVSLPEPLPETSRLTADDLAILLENGLITSNVPQPQPSPTAA
jgi:hypothetical protein